jgi:hypothetical protein
VGFNEAIIGSAAAHVRALGGETLYYTGVEDPAERAVEGLFDPTGQEEVERQGGRAIVRSARMHVPIAAVPVVELKARVRARGVIYSVVGQIYEDAGMRGLMLESVQYLHRTARPMREDF